MKMKGSEIKGIAKLLNYVTTHVNAAVM